MYRKIALLLFVSCSLEAAASCIASGQRLRVKAEHSTSPTSQTAGPVQDEKGKGSISGRVVNEDGTPAVGRVVFLYYGRRGAHPNMSVQTGLILTDQNGRFHVANLFAGEYIISVAQPCYQGPNEDSISQDEAKDAPYYKTELTYYGDTLDRKDAAPVWVKANVETLGVDITLRKRWLHKVSGTVFNRDGQPLPRAKVMMTRKQRPDTGPHSSGVSVVADPQGNWSLEVADGVYLIKAFNVITTFESGETVSGYQDSPTGVRGAAPGQVLPAMPSTKSVFNDPAQPRQVSVSGSDVPDVMIDMNHRAQVVSGKIVLENGGPIPSEVTIDVDINSDYNSNSIRLDGSFERKGPLLGERFLSVIIQPYGRYYVKSITWDGTDYLREPFEFGNGVDYKGVKVVLSPRGTLLEGSVRINGTTSPVTSGQVWLVPEDETKWRAPLTWSSSRIYEGGVYTIYAAPGDYLLIVDEGVDHRFDPFDYLDRTEDFVRKHAPGARHITLKAGEGRSVELSKRL
jgi:hypothetical protein